MQLLNQALEDNQNLSQFYSFFKLAALIDPHIFFYTLSLKSSMDTHSQDYIEGYQVHSMLGDGGQAKVYLCSQNERLVAVKVYDAGISKKEAFKKEVEFLSLLDCPNLINIIDSKVDAKIKLQGKDETIRPIVVLEYAEKGELYDYISNAGAFSHDICRAVIKKLIRAIEFMHEKGVTHRDLKLENILFDSNFELKVSDFGLSTPLEGHEGDGVLRSRVGTEGFRPPEMEKGNYTGLQADIFAIGVILFLMYAGSPPFLSTKTSDKVYKRIREGKFESFWQLHEKKKDEGFYSESFKRLMNSFFSADPSRRPTFQSLQDDEWLNGEEAPEDKIKTIFEEKFEKVLEEDEKKRRIADLTYKLHQQYIKKAEEEECDLHPTRCEEPSDFMTYFIEFSEKLDDIELQPSSQKMSTTSQSPAFVLAWLKNYLKECKRSSESFLSESPVEIAPQEYTLDYDQTEMKINVKLIFEIDEQEDEVMRIVGKFFQCQRNKIGVSWKDLGIEKECPEEENPYTKITGGVGQVNEYWRKLVIKALNRQIQILQKH